jgi:hypothetical protein
LDGRLLLEPNYVRFRGWFSYFGIGFVDPIYPSIFNRPADSDYLEDLYFHTQHFSENTPGILAHNNLAMFNSSAANEVIQRKNWPVISWCSSWGEYPMDSLWSEIAFNMVNDEVHNICELNNRVKIHWTRLMCHDQLFKDLASHTAV